MSARLGLHWVRRPGLRGLPGAGGWRLGSRRAQGRVFSAGRGRAYCADGGMADGLWRGFVGVVGHRQTGWPLARSGCEGRELWRVIGADSGRVDSWAGRDSAWRMPAKVRGGGEGDSEGQAEPRMGAWTGSALREAQERRAAIGGGRQQDGGSRPSTDGIKRRKAFEKQEQERGGGHLEIGLRGLLG